MLMQVDARTHMQVAARTLSGRLDSRSMPMGATCVGREACLLAERIGRSGTLLPTSPLLLAPNSVRLGDPQHDRSKRAAAACVSPLRRGVPCHQAHRGLPPSRRLPPLPGHLPAWRVGDAQATGVTADGRSERREVPVKAGKVRSEVTRALSMHLQALNCSDRPRTAPASLPCCVHGLQSSVQSHAHVMHCDAPSGSSSGKHAPSARIHGRTPAATSPTMPPLPRRFHWCSC
jgi:hypothetical protein